MNSKIIIYRITILLLVSLLIFASCKKPTSPSVTTSAVTRILQTSAYSGGQVTNDGGANIIARGVCWSTTPDPTITNAKTTDSTITVLFTNQMTGLTANTLYYVKAYATNSEGTGYGNQLSFTTNPLDIPTLNTKGLKSLSTTTAAGGGDISNDGGDPITQRGVCWNTTGSPTVADHFTSDGTGPGLYTSTLADLTIGTTYYVSAYATNSLGTGYGSVVTYTHEEPVLDIDGNAYSVVTIGTQTWFGENLKTATYNDGVTIPYVTTGANWANSITPAFCWFDNSELTYKATYGALYNWYAVNTGKLCPEGWHVPDVTEFTLLITFVGGESVAGGKLKEVGTSHWADPNLGATNTSGFTALPGGGRYNTQTITGAFSDLGLAGYIWTATETVNTLNAISYDTYFDRSAVVKSEYSKRDGGAVRCLKDSR